MTFKTLLYVLLLTFLLNFSLAMSQTNHKDSLSPDGKYIIRSGVDNTQGVCCGTEFLNSKTMEILHTGAYGGWIDGYSYGELIWSRNQRYVAIISRDGKRSQSFNIIEFNGQQVEAVDVNSRAILANISGRKDQHFDGHEVVWAYDFKWNKELESEFTFKLSGEITRGSIEDTSYSYKIDAKIIDTSFVRIKNMVELK